MWVNSQAPLCWSSTLPVTARAKLHVVALETISWWEKKTVFFLTWEREREWVRREKERDLDFKPISNCVLEINQSSFRIVFFLYLFLSFLFAPPPPLCYADCFLSLSVFLNFLCVSLWIDPLMVCAGHTGSALLEVRLMWETQDRMQCVCKHVRPNDCCYNIDGTCLRLDPQSPSCKQLTESVF